MAGTQTASTGNRSGELHAAGAIAPQLYALLRERIVRAELKPGEPISETEIARAYAVSRQPVREAFIKLGEAGLVQIRPQRGTFISPISVARVMDARFVREAIEADISRTAAAKASPEAVVGLREQIERQKQVAETDIRAFLKLDELFHRTLAETADVPFAWRVVEDVKAQMDRVRYLSTGEVHLRLLVAQHEAIVDAVAAADEAAAETAMRTHLREILRSLPAIAAAHPALFGADSRSA